MKRRAPLRSPRNFQAVGEVLEDRTVAATFGVPWSDPGRLTLSFAPDGTSIAGHASTLFQTLDAVKATSVWQRSVLLAFQTWAVNANINIGLAADGGQAFGIAGDTQHDGRFGDIRIGAQSMAPDVYSISVPDDPAVSSTLAGDVLLNAAIDFRSKGVNIQSVLEHEAGHVFGIDEVSDPKSPMYFSYLDNTKLTPADILALQRLYGSRAPDPYEGSSGNDAPSKATTIPTPGGYDGATPLVIYGDVTTAKDVDVYAFKAPNGYKGGATVRLRSAGVSLLAPRLTILDAQGRVLADGLQTSGFGDVIDLKIPGLNPNATYFARVQGATNDAFGIGAYGLAVAFDATNRSSSAAIDVVLQSAYQRLGPNDIASVFNSPSLAYFNAVHSDSESTAATLESSPGYARNSHYEAIGSISGPTDSAWYRIKTADAPSGGRPLVLTVTVRALDLNGTAPRVTIVDGDGHVVSAQILANGDGLFTVQAVGVKPGGNYLLKVGPATAAGSPSSGNFAMTAQFGASAAQLSTLAAESLDAQTPVRDDRLYVGQSQLMHLVLAVDGGPTVSAGSAVQLTILDAAGRTIQVLAAPAGDAVSGFDLLLLPGAYTFRFAALGPSTSVLSYRLLGETISDPIGPVIDDPTLTPIYSAPGLPGWFLYPGDILTASPFVFVSPTKI